MNSERSRDVPTDGERQGGRPLGDAEARKKGPWAGRADQGIAPAQPGGSDDGREPVEEGELGGSVVGVTTGSEEPATEDGQDLSPGDPPTRRPTVTRASRVTASLIQRSQRPGVGKRM